MLGWLLKEQKGLRQAKVLPSMLAHPEIKGCIQ
jgi:hypothetical protein